MTANLRARTYTWGELSRLWLKSAGWNLGRYTVDPSMIRAYADSIVRDGCATWETADTFRLTPKGWDTFYALTGYSADYFSATRQRGQVVA